MAKGEAKSGSCRFCGQQIIIDGGADMTEPQLEEAATMRCECEKALSYQEVANRQQTAKQRANELFGENSGEYRQPEDVLKLIENAVDLICDKKMKQIKIGIKTGLQCRIMLMAKDKIKIVRETSNTDTFEQ